MFFAELLRGYSTNQRFICPCGVGGNYTQLPLITQIPFRSISSRRPPPDVLILLYSRRLSPLLQPVLPKPPASGAPSTLGPAATDERCPGLARPLHHRRVAPRPRSAPPPPASGGPPTLGPAATGERRPGHARSLRHRRAAPRPRSASLPLRTTSTCSLPTTASRSATRCSKRTKDGHAVPSVGSGELRCVGEPLGHGRPWIWHWSR